MSEFNELISEVVTELEMDNYDVSEKVKTVFEGFADLHDSDGHKLKMIAWDKK